MLNLNHHLFFNIGKICELKKTFSIHMYMVSFISIVNNAKRKA